MLDKLAKAIAQKLEAYRTAVSEERAAIERERAGDNARQYAGREFENSEGFVTQLPDAAADAQTAYARARRDFVNNRGAEALSLAVTLMLAREKRDETAAARDRHIEAEDERQATGVHREVAAAFKILFKHGLQPRHLAKVRPETMAIMADLIRWDGQDPDMKDPTSPIPRYSEFTRRVLF